MTTASPKVISASRRTDIPAFYMDWFMAGLDRGFFEVCNPYNHKCTTVIATPAHVHTIVFWSKNFGRFITEGYETRLRRRGYHLFFNFTINSANTLLEPGVPELARRLEQLARLAEHVDPRSIAWRFDPICFYQHNGRHENNLSDFERIAAAAQASGVRICITSFMDIYAKIKSRSALVFADPPDALKLSVLADMQRVLKPHRIQLWLCCEQHLLAQLPPAAGIVKSSCIPNHLLLEMFGGCLTTRRDRGQRVTRGCDCRQSVDIGSYSQHPCYHNCLFCYANPAGYRKPNHG